MGRLASWFIALGIGGLLVFAAAGCGNGSDSDGTDTTPRGGDPAVVASWTVQDSDHGILSANFAADGNFGVSLAGACDTTGTWYTQGNQLTLTAVTTTPGCASQDVFPGDTGTFTYEVRGNLLTIWDGEGTTTLMRP